MAIRFVAYTEAGLRSGVVAADGRLGDLIETLDEVQVEGADLARLDGLAAPTQARVILPIDDLLVVVAPPEVAPPAHYAWHDVRLRVGPYLVTGRLPTMPGFDPARALARPTGPFVLLSDVRISAPEAPDEALGEHPVAWVNRYTVERVEADLELGFFFPGAASLVRRDLASDGPTTAGAAGSSGPGPSLAQAGGG